MPLTVPSGLLTKANFITAYLKPLVDANETNAASALSTANAANTLAGQKYTKPAGGIGLADLDTAALGLSLVRRYSGSAWPARGTTSTAVTVTWIVYPGQPQPTAANGVLPDHDYIDIVSA